MIVASPVPAAAPPSAAAPAAPAIPAVPAAARVSDFEGRRTYVLQRLDEAGAMFERSIELLAQPMPAGAVTHGSSRAKLLNDVVGATMNAAIAVQEGMLWYGDIRAEATLPAEFVARERPVLAHVMTASQGMTRVEGFVRAMLELGQAPLDEFTWREQALAEADDGARYVRHMAELVSAMQPRAAA